MAVDPCACCLGQPTLEILEKVRKTFEHRIGARSDAILPTFVWKAALHIETRTPARPPVYGLGEDPVNLAGVRFRPLHCPCGICQEHFIEAIGMWPDLARHETVRAAQQLQVIIIEDMWLALKIELAQRQGSAFDLAGIEPCEGLEIAFIRDPHAFEETVIGGTLRVLQNGGQRLSCQAPPLAAHMRDKTVRHLSLEAKPALQLDETVEQKAMTFPRERKSQGEAFLIKTADSPGNIRCRGALDEIRPGARCKVINQLLHRAQRKAGARREIDMPHVRKLSQHQFRCSLRGGHDPPCAPFTPVPFRETHTR